MPATIFGNPAVAVGLYQAFYGKAPANSTYVNNVALAAQSGPAALAAAIGANFAATPAADLAKLVLANLSISNATLETALDQIFTAYPAGARGQIVLNLTNLLSGLEGDATFGTAAKAYNVTVAANNAYSSNVANTTDSVPGTTTGNEAGKSTVLTTAQDVVTGTSGADFIRGVAGAAVGNQEQTTFNSSDIIDGAGGVDALILNLVAAYNGGARVKGIETLTLGTNIGGFAFDFNVNEGFNEISDVATLEYDQINAGERLTVNNIVKTAGANAAEIATVLWDNEAGSTAGQVAANFRASAVAGATNLNVVLDDVAAQNTNLANGVLDIGRGIETLTITSQGSTANTLNASNNTDSAIAANAADLTSEALGGNGTVNDSTLTKVVVKGAQAFGRAAAVNTNDALGEANFGLTNRAIGSDLGNSNAQASASNLISVAATVTEIDATEADGGVAMRFVSRDDGAGVNVTFKGGKAADYVEFERGNINATGGEGNDTFAFIDNALTSLDFGSADSITGGAGVDTIQLGVNGVGTVVANTTEFNNKTGIDVLDLRAQTSTVTLADAFVAGADAGLVVRSDRIVQSAASTANTTPSLANNNNGLENAAVTTVVLTELADNRAIEFIGGTGSDRVVVDNASANQFTKLDGGSNVGTAATGAAGSTDSLTVVNTAVLDANDVANIKGFELVNLVENTVGNSTFGLTLSEAFVLANSTATVPLTIASVTNTYGVRLGAGDVVNLEVSDLLTAAGALKATVAARAATNVQDLIAAGVTVNFQQNGVTVSTNAAPAALAAAFNLATVPAATTLDDVTGAVGAAGGAANNIALVAGVLNNGTAAADNISTTQANLLALGTVVDGLGGVDTLTLTAATTAALTAAQLQARVFNVETLRLADVANTLNLAAAAGSIQNITGGSSNDGVTLAAAALNQPAGGTNAIDLGAGADSLNVTGAFVASGSVINGGTGVDTLTLDAGTTLSGVSVSGFEVININGQQLTINRADLAQYTATADRVIQNSLAGSIVFADAGASNAVAEFTTYTLANGVNNFTSNIAAGVTVNGNAGADFITTAGGNDVITGGVGNDVINVGTGTDRVVLNQVAGGGTDSITGLGSGDTLAITNAAVDGAEVRITAAAVQGAFSTDTTYVIEQAIGSAGSLTTGSVTTLVAADFTAATLTNLAAFLGERFTVAGNTQTGAIVVNNGGNSYVYALNAASGAANGTIDAAEISLIGVVNNYAVLAADVAQA